MSSCWWLIIQSQESWWLDCEGKSYGPFATSDEARQNAIDLVRIYGDATRPAEILAPDETGKYRVIWSSSSSG